MSCMYMTRPDMNALIYIPNQISQTYFSTTILFATVNTQAIGHQELKLGHITGDRGDVGCLSFLHDTPTGSTWTLISTCGCA